MHLFEFPALCLISHLLLHCFQGRIQIEMLKMIEQMTGKSITDMFDWMVGTSTGAILALGMVYGQCRECMYIHNKEGRRVRAPAYTIFIRIVATARTRVLNSSSKAWRAFH